MRLKNKTAIVTGGGAGIGRAIATRFANEGCAVVIAEIDEDAGESAARAIRDCGKQALFVRTDVSDEDQVKAMAARAEDHFGPINVLCNNAAVLLFDNEARAHELSSDTWERTIAVNLRGFWLCSKYVIPGMLKSGGGSIIHLASPTGLFGFTRLTAYSASKGGVVGLMRSMAADYASDNIRVNAIVPGTIDTPMNARELSTPEMHDYYARLTPIGRLGTAHDLEGIAVFLASDESSYCVGGLFTVDGGQTAI